MWLADGWPGTEMPYSVSVPITRRTVMPSEYPPGSPATPVVSKPSGRVQVTTSGRRPRDRQGGRRRPSFLQVLAGVGHRVDRAPGLGALLAGDQRADVDDPLALLAGDAGPVVGVG